jgi:hypothetical protein
VVHQVLALDLSILLSLSESWFPYLPGGAGPFAPLRVREAGLTANFHTHKLPFSSPFR